jgi:hypothetical protein
MMKEAFAAGQCPKAMKQVLAEPESGRKRKLENMLAAFESERNSSTRSPSTSPARN